MTPTTSPLSDAAEEALATYRHHRALADDAMNRFLTVITYGKNFTQSGKTPKCVRAWQRWLADNGPNTRAHITNATGVKFTERGTPHTIKWEEGDDVSDDRFPLYTITRFTGLPPNGRGAPPTIYALWAQRFDVYPKFGVGPTRNAVSTDDEPTQEPARAPDLPQEPILGVVPPKHAETVAEWLEWTKEADWDNLSEPEKDALYVQMPIGTLVAGRKVVANGLVDA